MVYGCARADPKPGTIVMRLDLGSPVRCTDGPYGELADVVIDPLTRRLTHIVVAPHHRRELARLVPVDAAHASGDEIALDLTIAEIDELETLQKAAYLRLGDAPIEDPEWDVGISETLAMPYYGSFSTGGPGSGIGPLGLDENIAEIYDRVPKGEIEIRRASSVISSDEHLLGHVDGFVVGSDERISHVVLEKGHLWGKREITIPINAVGEISNDEVRLILSKHEVSELKSIPVHRWAG
ncbi:MAG: hypothetical protein WAL63_08260 [Solirubrobacteraceae bacterium]